MFRIFKGFKFKRKKGYSLLEMVVTLALTSLVMVGLVVLMASILQVTAMTYSRAKMREDLQNFVQEFEKDLRNASKVGECTGSYSAKDNVDDFSCVIYSDAIYRWETCERTPPPLCTSNAAPCDLKNATRTMCKLRVDSVDEPSQTADLITTFDMTYNMDEIGVSVVRDEDVPSLSGSEPFSTRRVIAFYAVTSHPNSRLGINNIIRQTLISTKNFDTQLRNND